MAPSQNFSLRARAQTQKGAGAPPKYRRKKLYIKADAKVEVYERYIKVIKHNESFVVSFINIYALYIQYGVQMTLLECMRAAKKCKLFVVDKRGYVVGRVIAYEKE